IFCPRRGDNRLYCIGESLRYGLIREPVGILAPAGSRTPERRKEHVPMSKQKLPVTNSEGFFEIRLESIGGLGANVAGKIIAEAGVLYAGFNGSNFASYGSEKKGSPVKSFIRFSDPSRPIRNATPVERPHVLGVFHEALL